LKSILAIQMPAAKKQSTLAEAWGKKSKIEKGISKPKRETVDVPVVSAVEKENHIPSVEPLEDATVGPSVIKSPIPQEQSRQAGLKLLVRESGWRSLLSREFEQPYMRQITTFLAEEEQKKSKIFPPRQLIFNAFNLTPFDNVKVVILGQDPYHDDGQAHGLCFSVPPDMRRLPPSLKNIFNELEQEIPEFKRPSHGCLEGWAKQGVFLLNATLTVRAHNANSHSGIGWQLFTDKVIKLISTKSQKGVVFLLWGNFAKKKGDLIDPKKHVIIKSAHPSPLSYSLFRGCRCFTLANEALIKMGHQPIDWGRL